MSICMAPKVYVYFSPFFVIICQVAVTLILNMDHRSTTVKLNTLVFYKTGDQNTFFLCINMRQGYIISLWVCNTHGCTSEMNYCLSMCYHHTRKHKIIFLHEPWMFDLLLERGAVTLRHQNLPRRKIDRVY